MVPLGYRHTPEALAKIRGYRHTPEAIAKISAASASRSKLQLDTELAALRRDSSERELFSERLRRLRLQLGLTQRQLGERMGIKKDAVSDWECGYSVPWSRDLPNIARALRVSVDYLLTGRETPKLAALHRAIRIGASREQMLALIGADADA